jgi:uncharacterized protein (DUF302 family)
MQKFSIKTSVVENFDDVIKLLKSRAEEEGFGTLTEINLRDKFKEKLNIEFENYKILGLCNPNLAHKVLKINKSIGLFLPCSIIVYEDNNQTIIELQKPTFMSSFFDNQQIDEIAEEVEERLSKVIQSIK